MSEQERTWVPGFIWVTPQMSWRDSPEDEYRPKPADPILVLIDSIKQIVRVPLESPEHSLIQAVIMQPEDDHIEVCETVEELAELIRADWRKGGNT